MGSLMTRLLAGATLSLVLSCPAWASWSLTQVKDATGCSSPCAVTVTATGAHHVLAAAIISFNSISTNITSVAAGSCTATWTHAANTAGGSSTAGWTDIYYCLDSASGSTSISITPNGSMSGGIGVAWELASTSACPCLINTGATPSSKISDATCTSCAGVALTLSANNAAIVSVAGTAGSGITAITGTGWSADLSFPGGDGVAHGLNVSTMSMTWTQASGTLVASALAFEEAGAAATCSHSLPLTGAGCT